MRKIILASASPRRKALMKTIFGNNFEIHPSEYEENNQSDINPVQLAKKHAIGKARDVAKQYDSGIVIAADSFVVLDNEILGKPKNKQDAFNMLRKQSGRETEVISGLAVIDIDNKEEYVEYEVSKLLMAMLTEEEIRAYIQTGDPLDKAGAFGLQDKGTIIVEKINGCYSNIVGLPLPKLHKILRKLKIPIFMYK